jgi:hypothetical protein
LQVAPLIARLELKRQSPAAPKIREKIWRRFSEVRLPAISSARAVDRRAQPALCAFRQRIDRPCCACLRSMPPAEFDHSLTEGDSP